MYTLLTEFLNHLKQLIMVSKSGKPPKLDHKMKNLLKSAQVIVANVEAPIIDSTQTTTRGLSLAFKMNSDYLKTIYNTNTNAQWIFSIANNHACDTSNHSEEDMSGVLETIKNIHHAMPGAKIIGAKIGKNKPVLSLNIQNGPKIGFLAWTEVMNNDKQHFKKNILREHDMTEIALARIKSHHDILIGFPHGNEEQSYYPLKDTRDRWCQLMGPNKFDVIVGHGPHVIHPAERVENRLLFHSIGNFCSPVGCSQTRVGCIPEIQIWNNRDSKPVQLKHKIHFLEQKEETVSLLENITDSHYPKITQRLRKIWPSLFS